MATLPRLGGSTKLGITPGGGARIGTSCKDGVDMLVCLKLLSREFVMDGELSKLSELAKQNTQKEHGQIKDHT